MARKSQPGRRDSRRVRNRRSRLPTHGISVRRARAGDVWVLVHPQCVRDRAEDAEEVRVMIDADEPYLAIDELRWLIADCSEFIEAHSLLGQLAASTDDDLALARGHFGFGYHLGLRALQRAGMPSPLPYRLPANQPFFHAGRGLVECLCQLDKATMAREVVETLVACDSDDPLQLKSMFDDLQTGGRPLIELE